MKPLAISVVITGGVASSVLFTTASTSTELTNALSARLSKLDSLESHGLIAIRPTVSNVELKEFIAKAKRRLFILTPWFGFVEPTVLEQIFKEKASIKGFSLKIILLHPDSLFLKKRAEVVFGSGTSGAHQSKKTLLILRNAFRSILSNLVEVRTYDSPPAEMIQHVCTARSSESDHI